MSKLTVDELEGASASRCRITQIIELSTLSHANIPKWIITQGRAPSGKCLAKLRGLELSCEKVDRGLGQGLTLCPLQAVVMVMGVGTSDLVGSYTVDIYEDSSLGGSLL
jgi:hypothetical protein